MNKKIIITILAFLFLISGCTRLEVTPASPTDLEIDHDKFVHEACALYLNCTPQKEDYLMRIDKKKPYDYLDSVARQSVSFYSGFTSREITLFSISNIFNLKNLDSSEDKADITDKEVFSKLSFDLLRDQFPDFQFRMTKGKFHHTDLKNHIFESVRLNCTKLPADPQDNSIIWLDTNGSSTAEDNEPFDLRIITTNLKICGNVVFSANQMKQGFFVAKNIDLTELKSITVNEESMLETHNGKLSDILQITSITIFGDNYTLPSAPIELKGPGGIKIIKKNSMK